MKRAFALVLAVLAAVIAARALLVRSHQMAAVAPTVHIDNVRIPELLSKAIRFRTTNKDELRRMQPFLDETWPLVRERLALEKVNELSRLYRWDGSDASLAPVVLMAHQDVVPVEEGTAAAWPHPPFDGVIAEGSVWGRGAADDKIGLVGIYEAAERLLEQGYRPRRTLYLSFGHDEETLGQEGARAIAALLQSRGVRPEAVFDEGGAVAVGLVPGLDVPAAVVAVAEKGYADFEVTATGEPGHSSSPPRTTAIGILARAITAIEDHPMPATLNTPTGRTFDWMVHEATPTFRVLLANRWLLDPVLIKVMEMRPASNAAVRTVCSVTVVEGGIKDNVLPQSARAVVNCRLITGDTAENVLAHFSKAIGNARVTVRVLTAQAASPAAPPGTFGEQAMQKTLKQTYPDAVFLPNLALGATDARHFAGLTPNIFRFVPIHATSESMKQVHGPAEHLAVEDARNAARYYAQLIVNLCGQ